jgi:hypothetical protein
MRSSINILLVPLCALVPALVPGCTSPTGGGGWDDYEDGTDHGLGWGIDLANAARDAELPYGVLYKIVCPDVTLDGEPEVNLPWQFDYAKLRYGEDVLIVVVQYDGSTGTQWGTDSNLPLSGLPNYNDAGPWVQAAAAAVAKAGHPDWLPRSLVVEPYDGEDFPNTDNIAVLVFVSEDFQEQITVVLDADTNEVLPKYGV